MSKAVSVPTSGIASHRAGVLRPILLGTALAGLAACGGGGGGGGSRFTSPGLNRNNALEVAQEVEVAQYATWQAARALLPALLDDALLDYLALSPAGVIGPQTLGCELLGTMTISGELAEGGSYAAGDEITIEFEDCMSDANGPVLTGGSATITVVEHVGALGPAFTLALAIETDGLDAELGLEEISIAGTWELNWVNQAQGMQRTRESVEIVVSAADDPLQITYDGQNIVWEELVQEDILNFEGGVASTIARNLVGALASTLPEADISVMSGPTLANGPVTGYRTAGYASGALVIEDSDGTVVTLQPEDTTDVILLVDDDGDDEPEDTVNTNWATLREGISPPANT